MGEFRMPALGADMVEGTVLEWRVRPGDVVHRGDVVAVIDTTKAEIDAEVFEDGVIDELVVAEGTRVPVGTVLAKLTTSAGPAAREEAAPPVVTDSARGAERVRISPLARRLAAARGIELSGLRGSGPRGAIVKADVERAGTLPPAPTPPPQPPPRADRLTGLKETTAALMARSKREVPHYYLALDVDLTAALAWMETANREHRIAERMLPAALLLSATARAAAGHPAINGFFRDGELRPGESVHLGVAISIPGGGLMAPAILDADRLGPLEVMARLRDLVRRARSGGLRASELSGGTLTVSSLGDETATTVFGVIYPPQVALVGFGRVAERPWAHAGMVGARPQVTVTLAGDHRASNGQQGAAFLAAVDDHLQRPEEL
jgi:pyruvate dehydrogenase E2 component (dihydrolipoamide acetyltransferase)